MKWSFWPSVSWKWKVYVLCVGVFGYQFVGHYFVRFFMYPGWAVGEGQPELVLPGLEKDWIVHESGRTEFWYLRGDGVSAERPGPAVLFAHGNAKMIDYRTPLLVPYQEAGISVFLCEFRGYGRSEGRPSEEALIADFGRVLAFAKSLPEVDAGRMIFHGRSLGGAVAAALASFEAPHALILESTFVDAASPFASRASLMWPVMIPDRWRSLERLEGYTGPTLILHGKNDRTVSVRSAHAFHEQIPGSQLVIFEGGGHRLLGEYEEEAYWGEIRTFLLALGCW